MTKRLLLGIDVGTSSTKALLADESGVCVGSASSPHEIARPNPGWSEQDPAMWWRATCLAIRALLAETKVDSRSIIGVGLSGQMHGSVFVDRKAIAGARDGRCEAIRPALLWNDQRTTRECEEIEAAMAGASGEPDGKRAMVKLVGNVALTGFTLPKVLWVRRHDRSAFDRAADGGGVCLPKDFVRLKLTGHWGTDIGDASGLPGIQGDRAIAETLLRRLDLPRSLFPTVHESAALAGNVTPWAARETGLIEGTRVVAGSGDNQCGAVGACVVEQGQLLVTLGTSGVVFAPMGGGVPTPDVAIDAPPGRWQLLADSTGSDREPGGWCQTGCMLNAAGALQWARDTIAADVPFDRLLREAEQVGAGCDGLVFLPYLTGERCPYPDPLARGGWIGLTARHTRGHLVRAVLEGVAFSLGQIAEIMLAGRLIHGPVCVGGGGAKSTLWRQILADVLGKPVAIPVTEEGPAYGAAILGGVGAGVWASVREACRSVQRLGEVTMPNPSAGLHAAAGVYQALYEDLRDANHALSDLERDHSGS